MTSTDARQLATHLDQVRVAAEHISDPVQRIAATNELASVLWDAVGGVSAVRLDAVAEATRDGYRARELSRDTRISPARITQFRNQLRKQGRFPAEGET